MSLGEIYLRCWDVGRFTGSLRALGGIAAELETDLDYNVRQAKFLELERRDNNFVSPRRFSSQLFLHFLQLLHVLKNLKTILNCWHIK